VTGETLNCPGCGEQCQQEMNFCPTCGTRLRAISGAVGKIIEDYRRQLSDNPQDANAHYNLALAYLQAGEEHSAEAELRRVLELEPGFADAHVRLAGLYLRRGEKEKARSQLQQALEAEPDNLSARRLWERC